MSNGRSVQLQHQIRDAEIVKRAVEGAIDLAVAGADAEPGREALRVPGLPPEQHLLPARVASGDPAGEARPMFKVRVIPCLDVTGGRVVKGIEFLNLRDAGGLATNLCAFYSNPTLGAPRR